MTQNGADGAGAGAAAGENTDRSAAAARAALTAEPAATGRRRAGGGVLPWLAALAAIAFAGVVAFRADLIPWLTGGRGGTPTEVAGTAPEPAAAEVAAAGTTPSETPALEAAEPEPKAGAEGTAGAGAEA